MSTQKSEKANGRRQFLKSSIGSAAAVTLPACVDPMKRELHYLLKARKVHVTVKTSLAWPPWKKQTSPMVSLNSKEYPLLSLRTTCWATMMAWYACISSRWSRQGSRDSVWDTNALLYCHSTENWSFYWKMVWGQSLEKILQHPSGTGQIQPV